MKNNSSTTKPLLLLLLAMGMFFSCGKETLPEEGSIPDATPPEAGFSYAPSDVNYQEISFSNLSISATDYAWDFGDGGTSADKNPTHAYTTDGDYVVSLTASDKLGVQSKVSNTLTIIKPISNFEPVILNPGFDEQGMDEYRDNWRNEDLGGVIQITSSPVHEGEKAAKLPSDGSRIGYQLITVEENQDYIVSFYYTMKTSPTGSLTVSVLAGAVSDITTVTEKTIESVTLSDQTDADTYVLASISFNSGSNTEVAIFFSNVDVECRVDTFTIVAD